MIVTALVRNASDSHEVTVRTDGMPRPLALPPKENGRGSAVNGGELLVLALATCYCNDVYREASRRKIPIDAVEVEASAEFTGIGLAASSVVYRARVASPAPEAEVAALLNETDAVAEVQNTVRAGVDVRLLPWEERDRP